MKNLVGSLLIAPPAVRGNFFEKSVILLTEHHTGGTVGVTLNKVSKVSIKEFARQNSVSLNVPGFVYIGGPVNSKALTMIHTSEWHCSNTMQINENFSISSSPEILTSLAIGNNPKQWRIFVGLCKWNTSRLQQELDGTPPYIRNHSWLTASSNLDIVFDYTGQSQWTESVERSGSEFSQKIFS